MTSSKPASDWRWFTATPENVARARQIREAAKSKLEEYLLMVQEDVWVSSTNQAVFCKWDLLAVYEQGLETPWLSDGMQNEIFLDLLKERLGDRVNTTLPVAPEPTLKVALTAVKPKPEEPAVPPPGTQLGLF